LLSMNTVLSEIEGIITIKLQGEISGV
jgi:hypothetical protein